MRKGSPSTPTNLGACLKVSLCCPCLFLTRLASIGSAFIIFHSLLFDTFQLPRDPCSIYQTMDGTEAKTALLPDPLTVSHPELSGPSCCYILMGPDCWDDSGRPRLRQLSHQCQTLTLRLLLLTIPRGGCV